MTFLNEVAGDLLKKTGGDMAGITIVFPNKRASLFFNKALSELSDRPVWSPRYTTISELFRNMSDLETGDHIWLVTELYKSYAEVTHTSETLNDFYNWGELMLADFDDVDKHLANARRVFTLIGDLHELDNVDYLTEEQQRSLKRFFSSFGADHSSTLKQRFITLWNKFHDIYHNYRGRLLAQRRVYEGMLYRRVIESEEAAFLSSVKNIVFVGFNLLNPVEERLFSLFQKEGKARFYWDFDAYYMPQNGSRPQHEAGKYITEYLRVFPNELPADHPIYHQFKPALTFTSSPTDDLQARYVAQWLTEERIKAGRKTAIVLADESLLETVLHCLPPQVKHVNITTGYPLTQHPATSFVRMLTSLLCHRSLTLHNVNAVLRHPYARFISTNAAAIDQQLNNAQIYYPTLDDVSNVINDNKDSNNQIVNDDNLRHLFMPADKKDIIDRLLWSIRLIAKNIREEENDFHSEGLFRMYGVLNRLKELLPNDFEMFARLLPQVIQTTTIPFHGEPIEGIQIMGVLETRNLDFDHILLLSANEGNLPAQVSDSSFIPHSVRRAYELTTVENKVAIYSYYFHRLASRANDMEMVYNSSANDGKTGEMSRFMLQLLAESGIDIKRHTLTAGQTVTHTRPHSIEKTTGMISKLLQREYFSPSALGKYLRCPLSFYYTYVEGIRENDDSDEEEMDTRMFGNIFHKSAELLYKERLNRPITRSFIEGLLGEKGHVTLQRIVDKAFREELFKITDEKRATPRLGGLQVVNREMVLRFLVNLLNYDLQFTPFTVTGTEQKVIDTMEISTSLGRQTLNIGGTIDRLDCITDTDGIMRTRIIDYKTGTPPNSAIGMATIADIFDPEQIRNHSDYYLQALLYSSIIARQGEERPVSPCVLYVQAATSEDYSPVLCIEKEPRKPGRPILDASEFFNDFNDGLRTLIEEICNIEMTFQPTSDATRCENCALKQLCYG